MTELRSEDPLIFDATVVSNLTGHADDIAFAQEFVTRFRRLLPERVRRIDAALAEEEFVDAMDAVLSLKGASGTVGAGELFVLAALMEGHLKRRDFAAATTVAADLPAASQRADRAFESFLAR